MKIKRICFFCIVFICSAIVLTGCNKNDNSSGGGAISTNVKVVNGSSYSFDKVKAVMYYGNDYEYVVDETNYSNGGFSINLPATIDNTYLLPVIDVDEDDQSLSWATVSDNTAVGNGINIEGYESGSYMGDFYYGTASQNQTSTSISVYMSEGTYIYVDKNVTITGSTTETDVSDGLTVNVKSTINATLKKGWNIMYYTISISANGNDGIANGTLSITTKDPGGLKWYYEDDYNNLLGASSTLRSSQPEVATKFSADMQKLISKHRLFSKSK